MQNQQHAAQTGYPARKGILAGGSGTRLYPLTKAVSKQSRICCRTELGWRKGFIDDAQMEQIAGPLCKPGYSEYLLRLLERGDKWK